MVQESHLFSDAQLTDELLLHSLKLLKVSGTGVEKGTILIFNIWLKFGSSLSAQVCQFPPLGARVRAAWFDDIFIKVVP